jgi:uncharacterized protein YacL
MEIITILLLLTILTEVSYLTAVNTKRLSHKKYLQPIFVDTSVLMDGRIIPVAQSGFIYGKLCIPRSVIRELQFMADQSDSDKRSRARHGLDVIAELQQIPGIKSEIFQDSARADEGVDERLLKLAKKYNGSICTIDFNLNKVAQVEDIKVLNVNDLAMSLRMAYLPGEKTRLELTTRGQDPHQAIGHLVDGTMVVVEHASNYIGKIVDVEFVRSLQTAAGKMMFAKIVGGVKHNRVPKDTRVTNKPKQLDTKSHKMASVDKFSDRPNKRADKYSGRTKKYKSKSEQSEQNIINLLNKQR